MKDSEPVDLVDVNGNLAMRNITRREIKQRHNELLSRGLYQPIVVLVLFHFTGCVIAQIRGASKGSDGAGEIDHVTGVISAGETWEQAAVREAFEEVHIELQQPPRSILSGVNSYDRFRTLATAITDQEPAVTNTDEVANILLATPTALDLMKHSTENRFVRGFFEDLSMASQYWYSAGPGKAW